MSLKSHFFGSRIIILAACWIMLALLATLPVMAQSLFYVTSSSSERLNTVVNVGTNGSNSSKLLSAHETLAHCTALAVDATNAKIFLLDGPDGSLWSANLDGSDLALVMSGLTAYPTDLALDPQNKQIYYTTSSTIQNNNTIQRIGYNGVGNTVLYTATGAANNAVGRCTALAVDLQHSLMFIADAGADKIWSLNLSGGGLTPLAIATNAALTDLALDVTNQQVYFTLSSPTLNSNVIQRVSYVGTGLTNIFTASGGVDRCTALDLDLTHGNIYLSDAAANTLWRIPLAGGSPTSILGGLPATVKKIRWYGSSTILLPPDILGFSVSGHNLVLNGTNGVAGGTYYILTSTNLALPLNQWSLVTTDLLTASGQFNLTITNGFNRFTPYRFYFLRVQ